MSSESPTPPDAAELRADAPARLRRASPSKQLVGLPVISLDDGERQGALQNVVYDPRAGRLLGFTVHRGGGFLSRGEDYWLPIAGLRALGQDAATIPSAASLQPAESVSKPAGAGGEPVLGKRLMTEGGKFLGNVDDVLIDRETLEVVAYEVSGGLWQDMMRGQTTVPVDQILSVGSAVVVVPDIVEAAVAAPSGGLLAATEAMRGKSTPAPAKPPVAEVAAPVGAAATTEEAAE